MAVDWNDQAFIERVRQAAMRGIVMAAEGVRSEALSLILEGPKTGRIYRRRGVTHQASAPGEAPASDQGRLVGSIRTEFDFSELSGTIIASTDYARRLELGFVGTDSLGRNYDQGERPFMRPALANRRDEIVRLILTEIQSVIV